MLSKNFYCCWKYNSYKLFGISCNSLLIKELIVTKCCLANILGNNLS